MKIKNWSYEEFPDFQELVEGATVIETTGDETGIFYFHDVEYADLEGTKLHLQILMPTVRNKPEAVWPCVVFVQGSAWMKQYVYAQIPMMANLVRMGYVVACVEYRHSGIASFPTQIIDAKNAVRFLKIHAEEYHICPEQMIMAGDSSGGHTAVFAEIIQSDDTEDNLYPGISAEVKGIVDFYGCVSVMMEDGNPSTINHHLPDSPEGMVMGGADMREHPDLRRQLSAECYITEETKLPPILIFHGTKDRTVNTRVSVNFYKHLKANKKDVTLYLVEGADHGGAEFWTDEVVEIIDKFIRNCFRM